MYTAVLDVVNANNVNATPSDLFDICVSKRCLTLPKKVHPITMEEDTRNKLDVSVFRQFRRLSDEELKWILPRPATSSSDSDEERMASGDEDMDANAFVRREQRCRCKKTQDE